MTAPFPPRGARNGGAAASPDVFLRDERLLVLARFLARMGFESSYFIGILGTVTYVLGSDAWGTATVMLVVNLALATGGMASGVLVDRVGPRRTLAASLALIAVCGLAGQLFEPSIVQMALLAGAIGLLAGFSDTAFRSFPPYLVEGTERLKRLNGLMETATNVAIVFGPMLGALVSSAFPVRCVFVMLALLSTAAAAVTLAAREQLCPADRRLADGQEANDDPDSTGRFWPDLAEGLRVTLRSPVLRLICIAGFLGFFAFGAFDALESIFYRDVLLVGVEWMGWLTAVMGVGCVAGSIALVRTPARRVGTRLLLLALFVVGVGSMLYVGTPIVWCAAAGQLVLGFGFGFLVPLQSTLVQRECDLAHVGRVTAVTRVILQSAGIVPLLFAPALASAFGVQPVLFGAACVVAAVPVLMGLFAKDYLD